MKYMYEILVGLFIALVVGVVFYVFSYGVNFFFGEKILVIVVFSLALFLLIKDILKKLKKKKDE